MTERRVDGFFYGLFMDSEILHAQDVVAENPRHAYVEDHTLRIGARATLVPALGARAYGMVIALTFNDLDKLYGAPGLEAYRPEAVIAHLMTGETVPALCYNLRQAPAPHEANEAYAAQLRAVLENLGFPAEYVASVS